MACARPQPLSAYRFSRLRVGDEGGRAKAHAPETWLNVDLTEEVVSPVYPCYVAVGTYAIWIAEHFSPQRWFQDELGGDLGDPDGDGVSNLME